MKQLTLISFIAIFLISCGNSHRSEYVSSCVAGTPGGSSYKELCECSYDKGTEAMSSEELEAMQRNYTEIQDIKYVFSAPLKIGAAVAQCMEEASELIN